MKNALKVARIHLVNAPVTLIMPWSILASAFVINYAIFALLVDQVPAKNNVTGGLFSILVFAFVANLQSVTQVFPFTAGLSLTRRAFLGGTTLFVGGQSLINGVLLTILLQIEKATNGWGLNMSFFGIDFMRQSNLLVQVFVYAVPFLLAATLGTTIGAVFKRWGQLGMYTMSILSVLVIGGLVFLITWRSWWPSVGHFFTDTPTVLLTGGYPLLLSILLGAATYTMLRRATP